MVAMILGLNQIVWCATEHEQIRARLELALNTEVSPKTNGIPDGVILKTHPLNDPSVMVEAGLN